MKLLVSAIIVLGIALGVYHFYLRPLQEKNRTVTKKTFSAVPAKSNATTDKARSTDNITDDRGIEAAPEMLTETEGLDTQDVEYEDVDSENALSDVDVPVTPEYDARAAAQAALEQILEGVQNELDESERAQEEAHEMLDESVSLLLAHLDTLSRDEQRAFWAEAREQFYRFSPFADSPELLDEGWQRYLSRFVERGYIPPE